MKLWRIALSAQRARFFSGHGPASEHPERHQQHDDPDPGNVVGGVLFGVLYERFPVRLRLPALQVGTGDG